MRAPRRHRQSEPHPRTAVAGRDAAKAFDGIRAGGLDAQHQTRRILLVTATARPRRSSLMARSTASTSLSPLIPGPFASNIFLMVLAP